MKHRLLFLSCLSVILVALTGCSKDEGSDTPLYQNDTIRKSLSYGLQRVYGGSP